MLKVAIIDSNYNRREYRGLAATWLQWEIEKAGIRECDPQAADYLLCTVSSQQGYKALKREIKRSGNKTAKVMLGGGGCWGPAVFEEIADYICVGEGQNFVRTFLKHGEDGIKKLPETWIRGESKQVVPSDSFPWDCPPLRHPDGTIRIFGSRGCKHKCLFCQTGWERKFIKTKNTEKLRSTINYLIRNNKHVLYTSNEVYEEDYVFKGKSVDISARYENINKTKIKKHDFRSVRIGIEGVSERLRKAIGKPVDNNGLLDLTYDVLSKGIGIRWFFIAGLPFETAEDWKEIKYLVKQLHKLSKGVVMMNFHAYIPQPATPLCVLPLEDEYWERYYDFQCWFFDGPGFTRRVQIVNPSKYNGRIERAMQSMAANENELRKGWMKQDNRNWRVKYLLTPDKMRTLAKKYGIELLGEKRWEDYIGEKAVQE